MRLKSWILVMLGGGILLEILIGYNAYRTIRQLVTSNDWISEIYVLIEKTNQLENQLSHLDNDVRGHMLTLDPFFKADFNRNSQYIQQETKDLSSFALYAQQKSTVQQFTIKLRDKLVLGQKLLDESSITSGITRLDSVRMFMDKTDELKGMLANVKKMEKATLLKQIDAHDRTVSEAILSVVTGTLVALLITAGAVYLLYGLLQSRIKLNRELRRNEKRLKEILDTIPAAVAVVDQEGRVFYTNKVFRTLFGSTTTFDSYQNLLKELNLSRFPTGETYTLQELPYFDAREGRAAQVDDIQLQINDKRVLLQSCAEPVFNQQREIEYIVSSYVDITERLLSLSRLNEAKDLAEKAALMKENFLANMSHEIRTPLNSIIGFTNLMATTSVTFEQKEYLDAVNTASRNLLTIVNDILDISKIEAGMLQFESIAFSIESLVHSVRTMLQPKAMDKQLRLKITVDEKIPPIVLGDPTRLTQILLNLASNAIKFTEQGFVEVQILLNSVENNVAWVQLQVKDTGIGISQEALPHIFERFSQESSFITRQYGGSGLGLNIVRSLVDMQGGTIHVESSLGSGSFFRIELPYDIAETTALEIPPAISPERVVLTQSIRVLVVEDNPMNQKLVKAVLTRMGYDSEIAENGLKALEKLRQQSYDLVLMDIQMPEMDGYTATRQIRTVLKLNVPIVAMTAHALVGERENCLEVGMNDFLSKPFQMEDLYKIVRKHVQFSIDVPLPVTACIAMNSVPQINLTYLNEMTNHDQELVSTLLSAFLEETPVQMNRLNEALKQQDTEEISRTAHALKSPLKMIEAEEVLNLILQIEDSANQKQPISAPLVHEAIFQLERLLLVVENTRRQLPISSK